MPCVVVTPVNGVPGATVHGMSGSREQRDVGSPPTSAEMLIADDRHGLGMATGRHLNSKLLWANRSDTGYAIASCACLAGNRIAVARRGGEEQLIIFAARERE